MQTMDKKKITKEIIFDDKVENLHKVLIKKAMGYKIKETTEEFVLVDDELKLTKKKVSVKYYPPDLNAIELILNKQINFDNLENLSDEELEIEKQKLLKQLKLLKDIEKENNKEVNNK